MHWKGGRGDNLETDALESTMLVSDCGSLGNCFCVCFFVFGILIGVGPNGVCDAARRNDYDF